MYSQGDLTDFSFMVKDGSSIRCHRVIAAALSPFLLNLLQDLETDQVILADFGVSELTALMNFYYTGR